MHSLLALPRQPEHPRGSFAIFTVNVARRLDIPLQIQPVQPLLLVDILRLDLAGGGGGVQKLDVEYVQFAFH